MNTSTKLFGTAGIRGLLGKKVTADLIIKLSQAVVKMFPDEGIIVGHDARTSSESLAQYALATISINGAQVYDVGLCTFPVMAYMSQKLEHKIGIYITASHNPPEYNGVKLLFTGREFTEKEQEKLEQEIVLFDKIFHSNWDTIKNQRKIIDANNQYFNAIVQKINFKADNRTLIVDCANGPMSLLSPRIFSTLGFNVITLNSNIDGCFPGRLAEPSEENLSVLINLCKEKGAIGIAHDGDGDRVSFIDEQGNFVELSRINALLAQLSLTTNKSGIVVLSIDSSTCIDNSLDSSSVKVIRAPLGDLHTKSLELINNEERVIFAAEPWKPIFPLDWGLWIDGLFGAVVILKELVEKNCSLYTRIKSIPSFFSERRSYLVSEENANLIFNSLKNHLTTICAPYKKNVLDFDGLRFDFEDGTWILIRKSGTEPKIRIYFEAPTKEQFEWISSIVEKLEKLIK
ncbi:hypothetical protein DRN69_08300 [Candidatus Pacearchaeota archaeon]|nr:MAG: hypothetical protein DRN69_08300 [Candidatus Pacearchaeota archaeon]